MTDPLAPLVELPGVADAATAAADALAAVHRHPKNLRGWPAHATESAWRGGRLSAVLDGAPAELSRDTEPDPITAGALRIVDNLDGDAGINLLATWRRAPLQALAKLHVLAAAGLVDDPDRLGRPRPGVDERLHLLASLVTGGTKAPAAIVAAVLHGELLSLQPFGVADGVVARASVRLVAAATGLDPHGLGVPEVYWVKVGDEYLTAARKFAAGDVTEWLLLHAAAFTAGAAEARVIADASP